MTGLLDRNHYPDNWLNKIDDLRRRVADLERANAVTPSSVPLLVSTADVSDPPTDGELDAEFGEPIDLGEGFTALVDDDGAGAAVWLVMVASGSWWYVELAKAV